MAARQKFQKFTDDGVLNILLNRGDTVILLPNGGRCALSGELALEVVEVILDGNPALAKPLALLGDVTGQG